MQILELSNWEGNAEVIKEGGRLVFQWPCGAEFFITPKAMKKLLDRIEHASSIPGVLVPTAGVKVRSYGDESSLVDVNDVYLRLSRRGRAVTIEVIADYEFAGQFALTALRRIVTKLG